MRAPAAGGAARFRHTRRRRGSAPIGGACASADPYAAHIAEASQRFGVPVAWIRAVLRAESAGDPRAISSAGAMGLMQIMPATWAELRVRHRLGGDVYDPRDNILAGTAYLRELHDRYGSVTAMLAAYNAGPGRYEASLSGRPLPAETRAYVAAIAPIMTAVRSLRLSQSRRPIRWHGRARPCSSRSRIAIPLLTPCRSSAPRTTGPRPSCARCRPSCRSRWPLRPRASTGPQP
jgi:soluble lytic murein transglycosylase-like protein